MSVAQEICRNAWERVGVGTCHRVVTVGVDIGNGSGTDLLFIEKVGNLVCPASWDLGETGKVVVFSLTEGEDKPVMYPKIFTEASFAVLNEVDLLTYLPLDLKKALACAGEVNPKLRFFLTSALTGEGMEEWYGFLRELAAKKVTSG